MINRAETLHGLNAALVVSQDTEAANSPPDRRGIAGRDSDGYLNLRTSSSISPASRWCMALGLSLAAHLGGAFWLHAKWVDFSGRTQPKPIQVTINARFASSQAVPNTTVAAESNNTPTMPERPMAETAQVEQSVPDEPATPSTEAPEPSPASAAITVPEPAPEKVAASAAKPQAPAKTQPPPAPAKPPAKPTVSPPKKVKKAEKPRKSPTPAVKRRETVTAQRAPKTNTRPAQGTHSDKVLRQESVKSVSNATPKSIKPAEPRVDAAPLPNNPRPQYPRMARKRGQEGQVILRVSVSLEGKPDSVEIKTSSGHRLLDQAALKTVKNWRFRPAREGGRAVSMLVDVPVVFRLDS